MDLDHLDRTGWDQVRVVVAGFGVSGFAAADNLTFLGADVLALDEVPDDDKRDRATLLETLGPAPRPSRAPWTAAGL